MTTIICAMCGQERWQRARRLCSTCYRRATLAGTLATYPVQAAYNIAHAARVLGVPWSTLRQHYHQGVFRWRPGGLTWDYTPAGLQVGQQRTDHPGTCQYCGAAFVGRKTQRYCGPACRRLAQRAADQQKRQCRCGRKGVAAVPDDLQAAWGAAYVCAVCLREGSKRAA